MRRTPTTSLIEVKIETPVYPSEDPEKVLEAVRNIVRCSPEFRYGSRVIGKTAGSGALEKIYEQARSRAAMGVFRRMLIDNRAGTSTWFLLNKQAATAGIAAFIEDEQESALGPIRVTLACEELDALTDWLAPDQ